MALWLNGGSYTYGATATWADLSGNARDYTATGAQRPALTASSVNGQPGLTFDGANTYLTGPATGFLSKTTAHSICVVKKHNAWTPTNYQMVAMFKDPGGSPEPLNMFIVNPAGAGAGSYADFAVAFGSGNTSRGFDPANISDPHAYITTYIGSGVGSASSYKWYYDNAATTLVGGSGWSTENTNTIGTWSGDPTNYVYNGDMLEIIVSTYVWTPTEMADLATWLFWKYAVVQA